MGELAKEVRTDVGVGQGVRGREGGREERSEESEIGTHAEGITDELSERSTELKTTCSAVICLYTRRAPQLFLSVKS